MSELLSNTMCDILELAARFKYITFSQAKPLLLPVKSVSYIRSQFARLKNLGLLSSYNLEKPIKSESMYFLTEKGKDVVLSNSKIFADDIRLVTGVPMMVRDYAHRKQTVQIHLSLFYLLRGFGITIKVFACYFDKSGNNRKAGNLEAITKIPLTDGFFIPDAIMLTESNNETSIYLIECFCDNIATRPFQQLITKHMPALALGTPALKFGMKCNAIVLSVFENAGIKNKVIAQLEKQTNFNAFAHLFFFSDIRELMDNPAQAFKDIQGNPIIFK